MKNAVGRRAFAAVAVACLLAAGAATAQTITLAGRMGDRALLVVDGKPLTVAPGARIETPAGPVQLLRWAGDQAEIQAHGKQHSLRVGGSPARLGAAQAPASAREIVLAAGPGGHFTTLGAVNGKPARFLVDTGATLVALGRDEAVRMGVDLSNARVGVSQTANGPVPVQIVTLNTVRVGDVEITQVGAVVMPQPLPYLLLGNSFLSRFQMQRQNDELRLQLR